MCLRLQLDPFIFDKGYFAIQQGKDLKIISKTYQAAVANSLFHFLSTKIAIIGRQYLLRLICKNANAPVFVPFKLLDRYSGVSVPYLSLTASSIH